MLGGGSIYEKLWSFLFVAAFSAVLVATCMALAWIVGARSVEQPDTKRQYVVLLVEQDDLCPPDTFNVEPNTDPRSVGGSLCSVWIREVRD